MKVIITKEQGKLGKVGSVVDVKDGYARNFLFPGKLAVVYTESNLQNIKQFIPKKTKKSKGEKKSKKSKKK